MGCGWRTFSNFSEATAPARWVGESGVTQSGWSGLDLAQLDQQPVIFDVADDRVIQDMVTIVVEVELLFEFFVTLLDGLIGHFNHL